MARDVAPRDLLPRAFVDQSEVNLASLSLTSLQDRIPKTFNKWTHVTQIDGSYRTIECLSHEDLGGVPHGIDADFLIAVQQITLRHIREGRNPDDVITVNPREVLRLAGQDDSGRQYKLVRESLKRLRHASYTATDGWYEGQTKGYTTRSFNILDEFTETGVEGAGNERTVVFGFRLHRAIRENIARGLLLEMDMALYYSLPRPQSRGLYLALESRRKRLGDRFTVLMFEWGQELKIVDRAPARIRRALEVSHKALIDAKYLKAVTYSAIGKQQTVTYDFCAQVEAIPDALIDRLCSFGLKRSVAGALLAQYGEAQVRWALQRFPELLLEGTRPRNRAGLMHDLIKDPDKYGREGHVGSAVAKQALGEPVPLATAATDEWLGFDQLTRPVQIENVFARLSVLLQGISSDHIVALKSILLASPNDVRAFHNDVVRAKFAGNDGAFRQLLGLEKSTELTESLG